MSDVGIECVVASYVENQDSCLLSQIQVWLMRDLKSLSLTKFQYLEMTHSTMWSSGSVSNNDDRSWRISITEKRRARYPGRYE